MNFNRLQYVIHVVHTHIKLQKFHPNRTGFSRVTFSAGWS